jgi:hypothetical protein
MRLGELRVDEDADREVDQEGNPNTRVGCKFPAHQAWMLRAYALGQGAGTQVLFLLPPQLLSGEGRPVGSFDRPPFAPTQMGSTESSFISP